MLFVSATIRPSRNAILWNDVLAEEEILTIFSTNGLPVLEELCITAQ
jgi:hypothetical protein